MYIRRKVYSDADYDYDQQFIYENEDNEALYSDDVEDEDDEPRFYSVIMSEDELALFSDFQEYLYSEDNASSTAAVLGGLGAATALGAGGYGVYKANQALAEEGGLKGVAKKRQEAIKAANEAYKAQEKIDAKRVKESVKGYKPVGEDGKLLKGDARKRAIEDIKKSTDTRLRDIRNTKLSDARGAANKASKESLKKGWEAVKGNKKLRYAALGAGALGLGAAGIGIGGKLNKKD